MVTPRVGAQPFNLGRTLAQAARGLSALFASAAIAAQGASAPLQGPTVASMMDMPGMDMPRGGTPRNGATTSTTIAGTTRTMVNYAVPAVRLVRADSQSVSLAAELDDGRAVVLDFIYTTCSSVCPLSSQIFSQLQRKLGEQTTRVHLVSISIDPEEDTPSRLRAYAQRFGAGPEWQYYTGTVAASLAAQRTFGVYRGDKMEHVPVTLLRTAPGKPWVRFDGFVTAGELLKELAEPGPGAMTVGAQ
jgi:protein SCO1